ncbi:hypothetical protein J41TS12_24210 [Paenibacillus antibioticophila]|uniref:Nucleotidyltransferase-like domain-containing protein n=1 Tax=Paenibacillus antibioticophila TaxID=1274374 RepID=A0A919XVC8_9BACL|nr:nucleotidyltransferase-like protein [Paenibacillus antibioticophila]GIO37560.1 hypothetical protein J41TS12_24210 [Paenibacillus antibioticophila]
MKQSVFSIPDRETGNHQVIGAVGYRQQGSSFNGPLLHDFELIVLVICDRMDPYSVQIEHCISGSIRYQIKYIAQQDLLQWSISGESRELIRYFLHGEIFWEEHGKVTELRSRMIALEADMWDHRKLKEFSGFLRTYVQAKQYAQEHDYMDAYYNMLQSLKHYARIELISRGIIPENSIWEQIRELNTEVYKLFDELTDSKESLEQRIELVLIACDFFVTSRMKECCQALLHIIGSRKEPWRIQELTEHPELKYIREDIPLLIRKLVYRSFVRQTSARAEERLGEGREIRYWL